MVDSPLAPGALRPGLRIYAIGDVHGCLDRLVTLHWAITADLAAHPIAESVLVHLGDYVDRGPDSAGVIDLLLGSVAPPVTRRIDLGGNHESMMLTAVGGDVRAAAAWLDNGGSNTLESYRVPPAALPPDWADHVPLAHLQWLRTREMMYREGGYLFVHAGIRPGKPIRRQSAADMLWIREPFLSSTVKHPFVVVHGHTPTPEPELLPNRIGIDTGAVMGGALTCVVLEQAEVRFLSA